MFSKLIPVGGDIMEEGLGLNQLDMQTICDEVSIGKLVMKAFRQASSHSHSFQYSTVRQP